MVGHGCLSGMEQSLLKQATILHPIVRLLNHLRQLKAEEYAQNNAPWPDRSGVPCSG